MFARRIQLSVCVSVLLLLKDNLWHILKGGFDFELDLFWVCFSCDYFEMWRDPGIPTDSFYQVRPECTHVPKTKFKIKVCLFCKNAHFRFWLTHWVNLLMWYCWLLSIRSEWSHHLELAFLCIRQGLMHLSSQCAFLELIFAIFGNDKTHKCQFVR